MKREQEQQHSHGHPAVPMQTLNGLVTYKQNRRPFSFDANYEPHPFRRFIDAGLRQVQLRSGVPAKRYTGLLLNTRLFHVNSESPEASGWLTVYQTPRNPGAASYAPSGDGRAYAGFHFRGIDPLSYTALFQAGPGSQPANPGGPGVLGGPVENPMTG